MLFLITTTSVTLKAQAAKTYRVLVEDQFVPREVRVGFKAKYPNAFLVLWYTSHVTYWYEDYAPSWYGNWYPERQVIVHKLEKPAYYEADFQLTGNPSRALFNRFGQWFETRSRIKELPETVVQGLKNSEFGDWMWSEHKERVFIPGYEGEIYRLMVSNKRNSYIVRLNEKGEILQIKYE